jgi:putative ABC transport system permease protein
MDTLIQDLRFGLRRLVRAPGLAAVALLTLALGIGANSAIFTVVNGVLFRPLPFPEPDRLVSLYHATEGDIGPMSPPNFFDWRDRAKSFAAAASLHTSTFTLTGRGEPVRIVGARVSDGFFNVLRLQPLYGQLLGPDDNRPGQHRVVVLGYPLWRERFGADPAIVGKTIALNDEEYRVAGVLPEGVGFPAVSQLWVPMEYGPTFKTTNRGAWYLTSVARLAPGASIDAANAEGAAIGKQLEAAYPRYNTHLGLTARPLKTQMVADVRTALLVLLGAAGFVLLIACANVANLFLARAVHREGEMAVRSALGGSRGRLIRQLITESLVLAIGGGLLGLVLAMWGTDLLLRLKPAGIPRLSNVTIDPTVLAFTVVVTMLTGLVFGCIPAWQSTRLSLVSSLRQTGRGAAGTVSVKRLRGALIVSEMALAVLLLTGAGLLVRSFMHLQQVDPGFKAAGVLTFRLTLPERTYDTDAKQRAFYDGLVERLRATPGVESVGGVNFQPMGGNFNIDFTIAGRPEPKPGEGHAIEVRVVTPEYFDTIGIPLRRGRLFNGRDVAGSQPVMLVSESAVRRYFPGEDPMGRHITLGWGRGPNGERVNGDIVGVVGDVKERGLNAQPEPQVYVAFAQVPDDTMSLVLRTAVPPTSLAGAVRQHVRAADPNLALYDLKELDEVLTESVSQSRFYMLLLGTFAAAALLLAAIGIFGVMSNAVAHRTREIGIRLALGAQGSEVRRLVLRDACLLAVLGIVIGVLASLQLTAVLSSLLFGLEPTDPITLGGVALLLLAVALGSSYLPAWRASRVDPLIALRAD